MFLRYAHQIVRAYRNIPQKWFSVMIQYIYHLFTTYHHISNIYHLFAIYLPHIYHIIFLLDVCRLSFFVIVRSTDVLNAPFCSPFCSVPSCWRAFPTFAASWIWVVVTWVGYSAPILRWTKFRSGRVSSQWIFQVPVKGGRDYITPKRRQGL